VGQPKPNITRLICNPPLSDIVSRGETSVFAYAPAEGHHPIDSEQFRLDDVGAFGAGIGNLQWRERTLQLLGRQELHCFKAGPVKPALRRGRTLIRSLTIRFSRLAVVSSMALSRLRSYVRT